MKTYVAVLIVLFSVQVFGKTITPPRLPKQVPKYLDALDFFVPTGSAVGWIIGGHQTLPLPSPWGTHDPEGTSLKTYAMTKFNDSRYFEVYKVDSHNIYIRYEAIPDWIRGFDVDGNNRGQVFLIRKIPSSGYRPPLAHLSTHVFLRSNRGWYLSETHPLLTERNEYLLYPASNGNDPLWFQSYLKSCNCGLDNVDLLLHISYWQSEGKIAEYYAYGYGVGLLAWRWVENLTLNHGAAVQKNPDGSGVYTCYLQGRKVTIKNWSAVLASNTMSVEPQAYVSLKSTNDTRVYVSKLNNPNINQSDWYVACQDNIWDPLTARQAILGVDLSESNSLPLPKGIFTLPLEYPSNLRTSSTFHKDDGQPHKILWDRAAIISTASQGMKNVQSYSVLIKQGQTISGSYIVSKGADSFVIPADYARGKYEAYVSAREGSRQNVTAKLSFTIY